jgi:hypothetical protein
MGGIRSTLQPPRKQLSLALRRHADEFKPVGENQGVAFRGVAAPRNHGRLRGKSSKRFLFMVTS